MDKAIELPIQHCDIKIMVGSDGVWLHLGPYAVFHVGNTLATGSIIKNNVNAWIVARQEQAKAI